MRIAALIWAVLISVAGAGEPAPRTVITPVLHTGDPAPGIPDATMIWMGAPQIDGAGNVLIWGFFTYDGDSVAHTGVWYGGPASLQAIAYEGMQAPDLPEGVVYDSVSGGSRLSENGWIGIPAFLRDPGITRGVNDLANFVGPPGDIRMVLQGGDQAPGLEPGTVIDVSRGFGLTAELSDNATLCVFLHLSGPTVDETNDRAYLIGTRDHLELVWRKGMPAPGTEPDVTFAWADLLVFNDAGQIAMRAGLTGDSIDDSNDVGRWVGGPGQLALVTRAGDPAPGFPPAITLAGAGGALTTLNTHGDTTELTLLQGPGITEENNLILYVGRPGQLDIVAREGDPAPEGGRGVRIDSISNMFINNRHEIIYPVTFGGSSVDETSGQGVYFGPYEDPQLVLRDGDVAPGFADGVVLSKVGLISVLAAMNDTGDVVTGTEIVGPGVTEENKVVIWVRDHLRAEWYPLLQSGMSIDGRVVSIPDGNDLSGSYWQQTGGSDGRAQSFNDDATLSMRIEFTDGTHGVFLLRLLWFGDGDRDGDLDLIDFGLLQSCFTGSKVQVVYGCESFDWDGDSHVDLFDYEVFLEQVTGPGESERR